MDRIYCQIQMCDRQAIYLCGDCKSASYCSNEHRMEHWRFHKQQCKVLQNYQEINNEKQVQSKRLVLRKQYFDTFSNKIYDQALKIAKQMLAFQKSHIDITRFIQNQFEYGITVCLLCRTLIILGKNSQAKIQITQYLKQKQHFLEDMRDVCKFPPSAQQTQEQKQSKANKQNMSSPAKEKQAINKNQFTPVTQRSKQFLRKKLELISAVANIFYSLSLPPIDYYTMYLNHIQFAFGPQSLEASNCYFLMGTYYMEQHQFNRSIACFVRAADIRQSKGGDCYYNLALIYQIRGKLEIAIKMFQTSIKLLQQQQGESSYEVAKIVQKIAQIMIKRSDFNGAVKSLEKALKIYSNKNEMKQFENIKEKIKMLHEFIKQILQSEDKSLLPKQIQDQLVDKKIKQATTNQLKVEDLSFAEQAKRTKERFVIENLLKLSENFLSRLNPLQIYRLSQLQLQLQKCTSEFAVAYTVANSEFMKRLGQNRLKEMKQQNQKLFELMNIERKMDSSFRK